MERMCYYTQQQGVTGVRAMSPAGGSDLAEQGGKTQRRSTILPHETLISPSESPRKAEKHVPRYMHTCTGPGALALANLQDQQGPARAARGRARPGPAVYKCRSEQVNNLGNSAIPRGAGDCLLVQIPPDLHLPYLPWCLSCLFCFAPGTLVLCNCPPFLPLLLWLQPESLRTEDDTTWQKQAGTGQLSGTVRCGTVRNGTTTSVRCGYVDSVVSASSSNINEEATSPFASHSLSNHPCHLSHHHLLPTTFTMAGGSGQLIPDHTPRASWPVFPRLSNYSWRLLWDNLNLRLRPGHPRVTRQSPGPDANSHHSRYQDPRLKSKPSTQATDRSNRDIPVAGLAVPTCFCPWSTPCL